MKKNQPESFKIAAIQAAPVFLDRQATVEKACRLIEQAALAGARLAVFPEGFIPVYPFWIWFIPAGDTHALRELYSEMLENAITIPDASTRQICQTAKKAGINVVMGINEINSEASGASLYNTLLFINEQGEIAGKHRKLVPTAGERLIYARGDGSTLAVYDFYIGRLGGLICWENYMPLARYVLYSGGIQIYAAPTWDRGEPWLSTLRHIAKEGRVFVIGSCSAIRRSNIPSRFSFVEKYLPPALDWINPGDSAIVNPDGKFIAGPVYEKEEIVYADIDFRQITGPRWQLDVAGHYARPDIFQLVVHRQPQSLIRYEEKNPPEDIP